VTGTEARDFSTFSFRLRRSNWVPLFLFALVDSCRPFVTVNMEDGTPFCWKAQWEDGDAAPLFFPSAYRACLRRWLCSVASSADARVLNNGMGRGNAFLPFHVLLLCWRSKGFFSRTGWKEAPQPSPSFSTILLIFTR